MRHLTILPFFFFASASAFAVPALAQQAGQPQLTPAQQRQFVQTFQSNVIKGCMQNPPKDISNVNAYCSCYGQVFVKRYRPNELIVLANAAGSSSQNSQMISLMMTPEQRACRAAR